MAKLKNKKVKEVLVVDDDESMLALVEKIITNIGMNVLTADCTDQAIKKIDQFTPHLLILDINLGEEKSGFSIIQHLKADPRYINIPILMLSADASKESIIRSIAEGANDFHAKPLVVNKLIQQVRKLLLDYQLPSYVLETPKKVAIQASGELIHINEVSCILQSSFKLPAHQRPLIKSKFLEQSLQMSSCKFQTVGVSKVVRPGLYNTELSFIGMDETSAKKIRQLRVKKR